ncbi:MAG: cytochrome b/b6 domain-containing protein [Paracoccaceae bacterium]
MTEISAEQGAAAGRHEISVSVWDIWVRLFHWSLVLAVSVAAVTEFVLNASWITLHVIGGLTAAALVVARMVWGFVGPTHARFRDFIPRPAALRAHLRDPGAHRHLGHNPLGALMVLALFGAVLALALTGLGQLGGALKTGPLAFALDYGQGAFVGSLHEALAIGLLGLVALHIAGVVFESLRSRENLSRAMVTGRKPRRTGDHRSRLAKAQPFLALAILGALGAAAYIANSALSARPVPKMPVATLDATYVAECSACHMAYHPSLLPAGSWRAMMATLDKHFGEIASLDAATTAEITAWLTAHAAETVDTKPAHRLAQIAPDAPFTLTETPFWKRVHGDLPDALIQSPAIGSRANCAACHSDAETGLLSPFAISIPKETTQ